MRTSCLFLVAALAGCDLALADEAQLEETEAAQPRPSSSVALDLERASVEVELKRLSSRARLDEPMPFPSRLERHTCSEDTNGQFAADVVESQSDGERLLPLDFVERLRVDPLARLEQLLPASDQSPIARLRSQAQAQHALRILEKAQHVRFKVVLHVTRYREPRLVWSLEKGKRIWVAGSLLGWLAVHEIEGATTLCTELVRVQNDVDGISTRIRLKEGHRQRLTTELAAKTQAAVAAALQEIAPGLVLPSAWREALADSNSTSDD